MVGSRLSHTLTVASNEGPLCSSLATLSCPSLSSWKRFQTKVSIRNGSSNSSRARSAAASCSVNSQPQLYYASYVLGSRALRRPTLLQFGSSERSNGQVCGGLEACDAGRVHYFPNKIVRMQACFAVCFCRKFKFLSTVPQEQLFSPLRELRGNSSSRCISIEVESEDINIVASCWILSQEHVIWSPYSSTWRRTSGVDRIILGQEMRPNSIPDQCFIHLNYDEGRVWYYLQRALAN